jgi:hypothetical protein
VNYQPVFRPEVISDLRDAVEWYESQSPGLGERFLSEYFAVLNLIRRSAETPRKAFDEFRRVLMKKFPFAVWYEVDQNAAIILVVWDCRQNPKKLRAILRSR